MFPEGENLDHQAVLPPCIALKALITGPCVGKRKGEKPNLSGFRQPLNFPPATFISHNLHNFASVRHHNLQKSLSKCKTKTLEHCHCLIKGKTVLQAIEMFNHPFWHFRPLSNIQPFFLFCLKPETLSRRRSAAFVVFFNYSSATKSICLSADWISFLIKHIWTRTDFLHYMQPVRLLYICSSFCTFIWFFGWSPNSANLLHISL